VLFAGGYVAGDRAARAVLRGRLNKLARGGVDLSNLKQEADGELVHVRGRIKAKETLQPLLGEGPAVYRRVVFSVGGERWVHEAAVDFHLVDVATGERVLVQVAGAHLVAPEPKRARIEGETAHSIFELTLDPQLRKNADSAGVRIGRADKSAISAGEVLLRDGDEVEVVGVKTRSIDPTVEMRLMRETPERATLRSGKELPLIVSPVAA
jgi:hypothetical protein